MSEQDTRRDLPLPVRIQPDPMLEERSSPWRTIVVGLAACVVVALVLYGLSRPEQSPQMAAATGQTSETAPGGGSAASTPGGQAQPANAPANQPQAGAQQPATTGQGAVKNQPANSRSNASQAEKSQTPPASGNATGTTSGSGTPPAPQPH